MNRIIFSQLNDDLSFVGKMYGMDNVLGIFAYGEDNKTEAIIIPTFEDLCLRRPVTNDTLRNNGRLVRVLDLRYAYTATKDGFKEMIEGIYTDNYIINPKYEHMYQKLLRVHRDKIAAGIKYDTPAPELKTAIIKIMRSAMNDNSATVRFIKELNDAEKLALQGLIQVIGDEGVVPVYRVASNIGVSRITMANLINKMDMLKVAEISNMGPKGTRIKILDDAILRIKE